MRIAYPNSVNEWFLEKTNTSSSLAFCDEPDYLF